MKLKDKVAIVTGAAQGIGREYALRFVEEGAAVGLVDTRFEQAKAVEREITAKNGMSSVVAMRPSTMPTRIWMACSVKTSAILSALHEGAGGGMNRAKPANAIR